MKTKLILIFMLLLLSSLSIAQVTKRDIGNTSQRDSGDYFLTYKDIFRHVGGEFDFWSPLGGYLLNFKIENDLGKIYFNANDSRELLVYDDDSHTWDFKYPISLNGVPYTTGGGDVVSTLRNTFTKRNTFDSLNVVKIVSDLPFYKGANTWIKTGDNFPLFLGANGDTAIKIDNSSNNVRFFESIDIDATINTGELNATYGISTLGGTVTGYDLAATSDCNVGNALDVTGDATIGDDLDVTGDIVGNTYNKVTITPPASSATLTIADGKTATFNGSFTTGSHSTTFTTTGTTTITLPTTGTLSTLAGSETFTNKSIDALTNTLTHIGRSNFQFSTNVISGIPVDSTIYYLGGQITPDGTVNFHKIFVPTACTIKAVSVAVLKGTAASSENAAVYVLANGTTATAISTTWQWTTANNYDMVSNTGLNISLAAGEYFNIKIITPNWGTNPGSGTCSFQVTVEILNSN